MIKGFLKNNLNLSCCLRTHLHFCVVNCVCYKNDYIHLISNEHWNIEAIIVAFNVYIPNYLDDDDDCCDDVLNEFTVNS